eukprot:tig00000076_g2396.t1
MFAFVAGLPVVRPTTPGALASSFTGARVRSERTPRQTAAAKHRKFEYVPAEETRCEAAPAKKLSKNEPLKEGSDYLRGKLVEEFADLSSGAISEPQTQLLKFHGSYMQDDREQRAPGKDKAYSFFIRTRTPSGVVNPDLYLALDEMSEKWGNHTLRATTRQAFQLHGILKQNLKPVIATIVKNLGSTMGACGDINRNVMGPAAPFVKPEYQHAAEWARHVADLLRSQASTYIDIWVDGEKYASLTSEAEFVTAARNKQQNGINTSDSVEPIYGKTYLPRKFKIGLTVPGDNSIDIYTQDIGMVAITNAKGELEGFNFTVGGGMGRTHNKEETFPRLGDHLGYASKDDALMLVKAIVATQRDFGNRENRRQSRMKYTIESMGFDNFKAKVEEFYGKKVDAWKALPEWKYEDYLGWHEQGDGKGFYGVQIENGRIKDVGDFKLKTALRAVVSKYRTTLRVTPHQNVLITDLDLSAKADVESIFRSHGVLPADERDSLVRLSMACPAMPMCGLAITEAERRLPEGLERIRNMMKSVGLTDEDTLTVRMTGCPNGCARPYMAELGFVGDGPDTYQLWVGGTPNQTTLAYPIKERVKYDDTEKVVTPILAAYKEKRNSGESFGAFVNRIGKDAVLQLIGA